MTNYKEGDYAKRGTQVFKVMETYHNNDNQLLFVFGPWNAVRFQKGEYIPARSPILKPATAQEYLDYCIELKKSVTYRLDDMMAEVV